MGYAKIYKKEVFVVQRDRWSMLNRMESRSLSPKFLKWRI